MDRGAARGPKGHLYGFLQAFPSGERMPIAPAEILVGGPESRGDVDRVSDSLIFARNRPGFRILMCAMLLVLASAIASF